MENNINIFRFLISICFIATLSSCGGGSSNSDIKNSNSADGMWEGYLTGVDGNSYEVTGVVTGGEFILIVEGDNEDSVASGTFKIDGETLTSTDARIYEGQLFSDVASIDGIVSTKSKIRASLFFDDNEFPLDLDYATAAATESITYSDLSGFWDVEDENNESYTINVDDKGAFDFYNDGCNVSGKLTIPNNSFAIISAEFSVSGETNCLTGVYAGLGIMGDDISIAIGVNQQYAIPLFATKSDR
jgi:hypothetical protein